MLMKSRNKIDHSVGLTMSRLESWEKACGEAAYTEDLTLPGMLHGALVFSPHAHARIISYDVSRALALPGVKAVLTGADLGSGLMGLVVKDETALAVGKVRYIGEPVAAVAAVDVRLARQAAALIEVEYDVLPAVFTIEEAIAADAPILHEHFDSYFKIYDASTCRLPNEMSRSEMKRGDVAKGFAECDVVIERVYETAAQNHLYLEPCAALASVDGRGKVTVWSSTQSVFRTQANIHESLGVPMAKIRSIAPRIGGGFGGKSEATVQPVAVALAQHTGRPVRIALSRKEDMISMRARHPARMRVKTGAMHDGTLVAREFEAWFDGGAYADDSPAVLNFGMFFAAGPYRFEHIHVLGHAVYTNKLRFGAFRGFGNPQVTFASESQIDEIAAKLGMDPLDLRLKNIVRQGDRWLGGQTIETSGLVECIDKVISASRWRERRNTPLAATPGKHRGLGLTLTAHVCGFLSTSAIVRLAEDGSVTLNTGAVDLGQGSDTVLSQMCAAGLGLTVDDVNLVAPDTDASPYNSGTNCSRVTYMVGRAVGEATDAVQRRMAKIAAGMLECTEDEIELLSGGLMGAVGTNRTVTFKDIAAKSIWFADGGGPVIGSGSIMHNQPLDPKHTLLSGMVNFDNVGSFIFGAQVVEVEIDDVTGKVDVVEAWCAHDVGRAVNPGAVEGQIHGGFVQGAGYALTEEMVWDGGRLRNASLTDYKIPSALDVPYEIRCFIVEVPDPTHPFGAKGVGEPPLIGAGPAIANAVAHAGYRVRRLPITPERMVRAMINGDDGVGD